MSVSKPKVVVTHRVHDEVLRLLEQSCEVIPNQSDETLARTEIMARAREAQALLAFMPDWVDEAFLAACPELRVVAGALKGYDNFDVAACTRRGIWLTIVPDLLAVPTAELAMGLLLGLTRHLHEGDRLIRSGSYAGWRPLLYGSGLSGRTIGILGMGAVGRTLARRLSGFDVNLLYSDAARLSSEREEALRAHYTSFDELLARSDILFPLLPLNEQTLHLFNAVTLARLRPGALLVNVGRGSLVDEQAVADALAGGLLGGYAADVFALEDWALPQRPRQIPQALLDDVSHTFFTPHLGTAVDEVRQAIEMEAAHNILQVFQGAIPQGAVNHPSLT